MKNIVLILDNLRSVYNTASLFRSADCFGIQKIYLCGTTPTPMDRFGRERGDFIKVSLGAESSVNYDYSKSVIEVVKELKQKGYRIVAIEQSAKSVFLHTVSICEDAEIAIILGNEVDGVDKGVLGEADEVWEIEQFGKKESLNVCIAGSIAMYHCSQSQFSKK